MMKIRTVTDGDLTDGLARSLITCLLIVALSAVPGGGCKRSDGAQQRRLELFVGSASKPPTEEAAARFEKITGAKIELHFGGSGRMLSEMMLSGRGDIYFPGSSDYMELAKQEGLVLAATERRIVYLIPAINVVRGNPRKIRSVADLSRKGLRVGIARPDSVCVGLYAVEVLESLNLTARVRPNIVTHAESCSRTARLISTRSVDAILGWGVFEHWDPENIETVHLPRAQVTRIGYIPAAVSRTSKNPGLARDFIAFLTSVEGQAIYRKWSYLTSEEEARAYATLRTPLGGQWELPAGWK